MKYKVYIAFFDWFGHKELENKIFYYYFEKTKQERHLSLHFL